MNFEEAPDYVRPEAPRRSRNTPTRHFNPLNYLRSDEEDGVVNLPSMRFVEMKDDDFDRLDGRRGRKSEGLKRGREEAREDSPFRKTIRGSKASGRFMKDFRDAKAPRRSERSRGDFSEEGERDSSRSDRGSFRADRSKFRSDRGFDHPERRSFGKKPHSTKPFGQKTSAQPGERLQKVLAAAGFGSRRDCEEFIISGRVMVDREVVTELGTRVLPDQVIHLDGELVRRPKKFVYFALNKPGNVICTNDDPDGRRRALDFINEKVPGLFPVGRLDLHSEGLLLVTNDGELANRLTHPSYEVPKVYRVRVSGTPTRSEIAQICHGVHLAEGLVKAEEVRLRHVYRDGTAILEITLREGRNREIRRILARIGHNVLDLVRVSIGDVKLGKIPLGAYRPLTAQEVKSLKRLVGLTEARAVFRQVSSSDPDSRTNSKEKTNLEQNSSKKSRQKAESEDDSHFGSQPSFNFDADATFASAEDSAFEATAIGPDCEETGADDEFQPEDSARWQEMLKEFPETAEEAEAMRNASDSQAEAPADEDDSLPSAE